MLVNGRGVLSVSALPKGREIVFRRFFSHKPKPLAGTPAVRRIKNYSAESGYAYQYFYEGYRLQPQGGGDSATEFVFRVSADRKTWVDAVVVLPETSAADWERGHERMLVAQERYAIAKMALFQAFDERPSPQQMIQPILVRPSDVETIVERLGL